MDGYITVCSAFHNPAVIAKIRAHSKGITGKPHITYVPEYSCVDFEWSISNDYIVSASLDGAVRVWDVKTVKCLRQVIDSCVVNTCRFHPNNTNTFLVCSLKLSLF